MDRCKWFILIVGSVTIVAGSVLIKDSNADPLTLEQKVRSHFSKEAQSIADAPVWVVGENTAESGGLKEKPFKLTVQSKSTSEIQHQISIPLGKENPCWAQLRSGMEVKFVYHEPPPNTKPILLASYLIPYTVQNYRSVQCN